MKKFFLYYLCFAVFIFSSIDVFSQDFEGQNTFGSPVTGPSPTAAALGKYGETPVGYYTGTPNISIPLYNVTGKHLSLPISLSYHASGIKVDEVASNVGLGWSLNVGGVITRSVKGLADESPTGFFNFPITNPPSEQTLQSVADGTQDSEPDIFYFNFAGYSGKFVFNQNQEPVLIPYQDIIIKPNASFNSWTITTPDGVIYTFDQLETTETESQDTPALFTSSWFLTYIKHPVFTEAIALIYDENYSIHYVSGFNEAAYAGPSSPGGVCSSYYNENLIENSPLPSFYTSSGAYVSEIRTATSIVKIDYELGREDLPIGGKKLEKIEIYSNLNSSGTPLQYFSFDYDYFTASGSNIPSLSYPENQKRLKLLSVSRHAGDDSLPPEIHSFSYNEGNGFNLPPRLSMQQDHWGYANKNEANTLIPSNSNFVDFANGADRSPDANLSQANILTQINYPTGGYSKFVYEPHRYSHIQVLNGPACLESYVDNPPITAIGNSEVPFSVDYNQYPTITSLYYGQNSGDVFGIAEIQKENSDGTWTTFWIPQLSPNDPANQPPPTLNHTSTLFSEGNYKIVIQDLAAGEVAEISVYTQSLLPCDDDNPTSNDIGAMAGGVRIKQLILNDGEKDMVQSFEYLDALDNQKSSGVLISRPQYFFNFNVLVVESVVIEGQGVPTYIPCYYPAASSRSKSPLGATQGSHIGYLHTKVYKGTSTENEGYSDYTYSFAADIGDFKFPFGDITSNEWQRGLLLHQKDVSKAGTTVREVINDYDLRENKTINNKKVTGFRVANYYANSSNTSLNYTIYKTYDHISRWFYLKKSTEILDGVSKIVNYEYDQSGATTKPKSIAVINSDEKEHKLEYKYGNTIPCLDDKYMIHVPVQTKKLVDGVVVGGSRTGYTGCLATEFYEILDGTPGNELLRGSISGYTADGYPNDYTKMGFAIEDYSWDNGLMKTRDFLGWHWEYDYDEIIRQPTYMKDIDGQESFFAYDGFQRLHKVGARVQENVVGDPDITMANHFHIYTTHEYSPNILSTETIYSDGPSQSIIKEYDGLGRYFKTIHNGVVKDEKFFNKFGQIWKEQYLPDAAPYGQTFTHFDYDGSPLNRVVLSTLPDYSTIKTEYGAEGNYYKVSTTDEIGLTSSINTEIIGRQAKIKDTKGGNTVFQYFNHGGIQNVIAPDGSTYVYTYDGRKRLETKTIPAGGIQTFTYYDENDLLETAADANGNVLTYRYDDYGREEDVTLLGTDGASQIIKINTYGSAGIEVGKIKTTEAEMLDGSGTVFSIFGYDEYGRIETEGQSYPLSNGDGGDKHTYTYNHLDWLQKDSRKHAGYSSFSVISGTSYDAFGRVIYQSTIAPGASGLEGNGGAVKMRYNDRDEMVYKYLSPQGAASALERIDYKYHIRGWLTDINNPILPIAGKIDQCGEPEITSSTNIQVETTVDLAELLDLISSGTDVVIGEADPCDAGDCVEYIYDYELRFINQTNSILYGLYTNEGLINLPNYPYNLKDDAASLELHLMQWFEANNHSFESITLTLASDKSNYILSIKQTDVIIDDDNYANYGCSYSVDFKRKFNGIYSLRIGDEFVASIPNEGVEVTFPFCSLSTNQSERDRFLSELNSWLEAKNYHAYNIEFTDPQIPYVEIRLSIVAADFELRRMTTTTFTSCSLGEGYETQIQDINQELCDTWIDITRTSITCKEIKDGKDETIPSNQVLTQADALIVQADASRMTFPDVLYKTQFPEGNTRWLFKSELQQFKGRYNRLERLAVKDQNQNFKVFSSEGMPQIMNLSEFLTLRNTPLEVAGIGVESEEDCTFPPLGCSDTENEAQQESVEDIMDQMSALNPDNLQYPITLHLVRLCDGSTIYVLDNLLNDLMGQYVIIDDVEIAGPDDLFDVVVTEQVPVYSQTLRYLNNGNISKTNWQVTNQPIKHYAYSYDELNRLTTAIYDRSYNIIETTSSGLEILTEVYDHVNRYTVGIAGYSETGNIGSIIRNGVFGTGNCLEAGPIDDLDYSYSMGRLKSVTENVTGAGRYEGFNPGGGIGKYQYDANGNLTNDPFKGISFEYNYLNLPKSIDGNAVRYDANGTKWKQTINGEVHEYIGGIEYVGQAHKLLHIMHSEGRMIPGEGGADGHVEYFVKDHLGNTRVTIADINKNGVIDLDDDPNTPENESELLQENHYYPFGMDQKGAWIAIVGTENNYLYNGKEFVEDVGLYDYGARFYDPAIARWTSIDPLAEDYYAYSPYNYVLGNPISNTDPDGRSVDTDYYNLKGNKVKHVNDGSNDKVLVLTKSSKSGRVDQAISKGAAVSILSNGEISEIENVYSRTETDNNHEEGFVGGKDSNGNVVTSDITSTPNKHGLEQHNVEGAISNQKSKGGSVEYSVHSHPVKDTEKNIGVQLGGLPIPSGEDKTAMGTYGLKFGIIAGYNKGRGQGQQGDSGGDKRVLGFYSPNGNNNTINFKKYQKVAAKINKK